MALKTSVVLYGGYDEKIRLNLHLFDKGTQGGDSSQNTGSNKNNATFTYEQSRQTHE